MTIVRTLKSLTVGSSALVAWRLAGTNTPPISMRLTVKRSTSRSITLVDASGEFTSGWSIKFADIGNEAPFANEIVEVTA